MDGGDGSDNLLGGAGDDNLNGDGGDDQIDGGMGSDACWGGDGADHFSADDNQNEAHDAGNNDVFDPQNDQPDQSPFADGPVIVTA